VVLTERLLSSKARFQTVFGERHQDLRPSVISEKHSKRRAA
jgi:hypothetical protein